MKKIGFCLKGLGYEDQYQADIYLKEKDSLHFVGRTYHGKIELCLEEDSVYTIIAITKREMIKRVFYVNPCQNQISFCFPRNRKRRITFQLTDAFYKNLPIEKGEIILG